MRLEVKKNELRQFGIQGFTMVELLMVVLLLSILAAIGITQYKDFTKETRNSATKANLQIIRNGIGQQYGQMRLRCGYINSAWPALTDLNANNITTTSCTTLQIPSTSDRLFAVASLLPPNPWGINQSNAVVQCVGLGCTVGGTSDCTAAGLWTAETATDDGWCYNVSTGQLWPNSARNDGQNAGTGNEYTY